MSSSTYDLIVVGLGAAGVTALTAAVRGGKRALGLEAQDRLGGRVCTRPFAGGLVEMGAEWIHGTEASKVYELAIAHNVSVIPQDLQFSGFRSDGSRPDAALLNELLAVCVAAIEAPPQSSEPVGQYVMRKCNEYIAANRTELLKDPDFVAEFYEFMNLLTDNYESSNDWNDVTTSSKYEELEGHQHMSWHKHGYWTLFDILLNKYKNSPGLPNLDIKLKAPVSNIHWSEDPSDDVTVTASDQQYRARSVIVTVSLGVLKEQYSSMFTPPLPQNKIDAINHMTIGVMDKIILSFSEAWWPKDKNFFGFIWRGQDKMGVPKEDYWTTRIYGASRPLGCEKALTLWTSGDVAKLVETLPEDVVKRKSMELIRRFMGSGVTIPEPTGIVRSTWFTNPYTRGSYSYDHLNSTSYPNAREDLAAPVLDRQGRPKIMFAGEATNNVHFSTVHGAMETGYREANRFLASVKNFFTLTLFIQTSTAYSIYMKMAEINNVSTHAHFKYKHIVQLCSSKKFQCNTNTTNVCAMRKWRNETIYKDFENSCVLFLSNMCDYPGNEFYIVSGGSCSTYLQSRRSVDNDTLDDEYEYYTDNSTEFNDTTKQALRAATTTPLYTIEDAYDGHLCPYHCTDTYEPRCISVNRNFGKYFKFMTFLNHCQGDMYYCKHWEDFAPPPDESEEMINDSPLGWSYCGASRYLQFARFSEVASSMGHYGWLRGDYKYSHILEPEEKARLN